MPLTELQCKNAKPEDKPRRHFDGFGMYLEVMPSGSKYWRMKYRMQVGDKRKEKRLALGVYPQVTLAEARVKRDAARKLLADGIDPSTAKKQRKREAALNAENTFEALAREWHELQSSKWSKSHADNIIHRLQRDIFPALGNMPIADIKPLMILDTVKKIEQRGAHEVARRTLRICGQVFKYAIIHGKVETNPAADLSGALKPVKTGHYAALDVRELPEFLDALQRNDARLYPMTRNALNLLMLTFVRTSELIQARWEEIDLDNAQWIIPAKRMKMNRDHIVPLSRQAIEILEAQRELTGQWEWVFPNQVRPRKTMSNNTILKAIERLGYKGRMTGHGFRALAMSAIKEKLGYRHEVIDRQLAHAPQNKVDRAYDRAAFLDERRRMMQEWADHLDELPVCTFKQSIATG